MPKIPPDLPNNQAYKCSKGIPTLIGTLLVFLTSTTGFFAYKYYSATCPQPQQAASTPKEKETVTGETEKPAAAIELGQYQIEGFNTGSKSWEELVYLGTSEIPNLDRLYEIFSQEYPEYVSKKSNIYVKDIVLSNGQAKVYFGGDHSALTERMGSTGAYNYAGLIVFALTQDNRIPKVELVLDAAGSHLGPGVYTREDFRYLWPQALLESASSKGDVEATRVLKFRE